MVFAKTGSNSARRQVGRQNDAERQRPCRYVSPKTAETCPSPRTVNHVLLTPIRKLRSYVAGQAPREIVQPPMMPIWKPREERATTISLSATVTSSMHGKSRYAADVGVSGDAVATIRRFARSPREARNRRHGPIVAPGFIEHAWTVRSFSCPRQSFAEQALQGSLRKLRRRRVHRSEK